MKLLFIACRPSEEFQKALDHHQLSIQAVDSAEDGAGAAELIAWKIADEADLKQLKKLRAAQKNAWISLIVPDAWLSDSNHYAALLAATQKDDVWLESNWESGFWLGLQRAVQSRASRHREKHLQDELDKIQREQESLVASSSALVEKLEVDAGLASQIHRKFYPRFSPDVPGVEVFSKYLPASGTGGDYFDIFEFGDKRRFGLLLADGTSHKSAASLLSVLLKVRLDDLRERFASPGAFVKHLNDAVLAEQPKSPGTLKLCYGIFDRAKLSMDLTCAGGHRPRLLREGKMQSLQMPADPALTDASHVWRSESIQLQPGDTLLLFSDGLEKNLGENGVDRFISGLDPKADALEIRNALLAQVDASRSKKALEDDLTFLLLRVDARALFVAPAIPIRRR